MQDVFNQMQFMADYLDVTNESSFNFEDFFIGTGSTFTLKGSVVDDNNNEFKLILSGNFNTEKSNILWNGKDIRASGVNEYLRSNWKLYEKAGNEDQYVPTVMFTVQGRHIDKYINK